MATINKLFNEAQKLPYSERSGMVKIPDAKPMAFGFFPGGLGTYDQLESFQRKEVLVLGQDWGTFKSYIVDRGKKREERELSDKTWGSLLPLFRDIKEQCFFTNVYMGLRKEGKIIGKSPAKSDPEFVAACQDFFKKQIELIEPNVVFVLGKEPAKFLQRDFEKLRCWNKTFKELDKKDDSIITDKGIVFTLLIHPSMANSNRKHRSEEQEIAIIKKSLEKARENIKS